MPSKALKQVFSLAKAQTVAAWKAKTVFCSGSGEAEFPLEQQITKRGGCLLFPLNWAQSPPSPRCWHKTKLLLLGGYTPVHCRKSQVTASWQSFLLHGKYANSAGFPACLCFFLCWAQPGVTQVRLHTDIQEAQRAFIYFLHAAERALKGAC